MGDFLNSILDFFERIGEFIHMMVSGVSNFFGMLPHVLGLQGAFSMYFPSFIAPFLAIGLLLLIIKVVLDLL